MKCAYCSLEAQEIIRTDSVGLQIPICGKCEISKEFVLNHPCGYCGNEVSKRIELKDGFTMRICNDCEKLRDIAMNDFKK